jgi:hypothetical protein
MFGICVGDSYIQAMMLCMRSVALFMQCCNAAQMAHV